MGADVLVAAGPHEKSGPTLRNTGRAQPGVGRGLIYLMLSAAAAIALWELVSLAGVGSGLLPGPAPVASELWHDLSNGTLIGQAGASLRRIVIGFALGIVVAIPTGFIMGWYRWAAGLFEPWVQFLRAIPPLALIPLVIVVIGIGENAKIFLIFLAAYLGMVIAVCEGVRNLDRTLVSAARVLGAGDRAIFMRVVVPATLPYLFVGLRVGLGNAWATVVAAEIVNANSGLGQMMENASNNVQMTTVMVGLITIGFLALIMDRTIVYVGRYLTRWQDR
jgi:NitT/TauT family transport system permease protein